MGEVGCRVCCDRDGTNGRWATVGRPTHSKTRGSGDSGAEDITNNCATSSDDNAYGGPQSGQSRGTCAPRERTTEAIELDCPGGPKDHKLRKQRSDEGPWGVTTIYTPSPITCNRTGNCKTRQRLVIISQISLGRSGVLVRSAMF